jgi:hypothetical protein
VRDVERSQVIWFSTAKRVAAAREETSSLLKIERR